jgi:diadenosine tetraphosphate (Ap4A) HIT family hydrolase
MKLLNANYEPKATISTSYILEEKKWRIVNHIHVHLFPMYQTNHQVSFITFHHFMNKFNIIWSLAFGQVHILDLPLLQIQNSYLNYS